MGTIIAVTARKLIAEDLKLHNYRNDIVTWKCLAPFHKSDWMKKKEV